MSGNKNDDKSKENEPNGVSQLLEMEIRHPLQNTWCLWFYEPDKKKSWEDCLRKITSFTTVEDFWSIYNHIKTASELRNGCDYSIFKEGIRPMWEDSANKKGGRWLISFDKKNSDLGLNDAWLETLLIMIGEGFEDYSDDICGAVLNVRVKVDKIALWTADADLTKEKRITAIGKKLKERLKLSFKTQIVYQAHKDTEVKTGSVVKSLFSV